MSAVFRGAPPRRRRCAAAALLGALVLLAGCVGAPSGIEPVTGFELERYLGTWYEVARLDHGFERGLSHVTATYTPREEGGISVLNRGYLARRGEWREAEGRAYFVGDEDVGQLKVSFFGPFFGGYNIIALDHDDYRHAMVAGPTRGYLWILAREPSLPPGIFDALVARARALGFDTEELIRVEHGPLPPGADAGADASAGPRPAGGSRVAACTAATCATAHAGAQERTGSGREGEHACAC